MVSFIVSYLANETFTYASQLKAIKDFFAGFAVVVYKLDGIILSLMLVFAFFLFLLYLLEKFNYGNYGEAQFRYWNLFKWLINYFTIALFYTAVLIMMEPNLATFFGNIDTQFYGFSETLTALMGIGLGATFTVGYVGKFLQEYI